MPYVKRPVRKNTRNPRPYRKKRVYKRPAKQVKRLARQEIFNQIPTKKHVVSQNLLNSFGAIHGDDGHALDPETEKYWALFKPLALAKSAKADDGNTRTEEFIYAKNYLLNGELMMPKDLKGCCQVRVLMGYWKGTQSLTTQQFTGAILDTVLSSATDKFDPQSSEAKAFKIVSDTMRTYHPIQIYDNTSGESAREEAGLGSDNVALWKPIVINRNFRINRKIKYDSDDGDSQVGWLPFIAIGCFPCHNASIGVNNEEMFNRVSGQVVSPAYTYESRMYFKDVNN